MNTVINLFQNLWNALGCVVELLGYLLRFVSVFFRTRASLATRLLAAESQLSMCQRRIDQKLQPKPTFTAGFRLLWVWWSTDFRFACLSNNRVTLTARDDMVSPYIGRR